MAQRNHNLAITAKATIAAAATVTGLAHQLPRNVKGLTVQMRFLYGSGGTDVTLFIQTSFDAGDTWVDIMAFNVTTSAATKISAVKAATAVGANYTPTEASLTDDTIKDGLIGDRVRAKYVSTGTYAGATSIEVDGMVHS